jgi:hypothetical protein
MRNSKSIALAFVCLLAAPAIARADDSHAVVGVWLCSVVRSGTLARPIIYSIGGDGIFGFVSGTTINNSTDSNSAVNNSGILSRPGGGRGEWTFVPGTGNTVISSQYVELLSNDRGNVGGYFNVDSTYQLLPNGQLCSGRSECPNAKTYVSLVKFEFPTNAVGNTNPDGPITGQHALLPTGSQANSICNRISSGLGFPAPLPQLVPAK